MGRKKEGTPAERKLKRGQHAEHQQIEGKFGELKTRYGLSKISVRVPDGQLAQISLAFLAANIQAYLRLLPVLVMLCMLVKCFILGSLLAIK